MVRWLPWQLAQEGTAVCVVDGNTGCAVAGATLEAWLGGQTEEDQVSTPSRQHGSSQGMLVHCQMTELIRSLFKAEQCQLTDQFIEVIYFKLICSLNDWGHLK